MAAPKQGGFKMSLGGLKIKPSLKAVTAEKDVKRRRLALDDDEPGETNKQQEIVGFDAAEGGAIDVGGKKEKEGPRIIPVQPTRDWRIEARRKQLAKAPHAQEQNAKQDAQIEVEAEEPKLQYGLTFAEKKEEQTNGAEENAPEPMEIENDDLTEEQRLEKKALAALISGKSADDDLVIPVATEDEALQNDLDNAPEAPTLEAYQAQPIEGFGAALLRGMGWKDGEALGKNGNAVPQKVKRRPALLGIGAKEEAAVGIELGAWGGKGKGKGKKVDQAYNPVALRNKKTGEIITEEELQAKLETQDMVVEEKASRDRSRYEDDEQNDRRREKRRDRRDDRDRDRRRDDDYDSERRRERNRKDERRRDRDDRDDSDQRRERRRDRDDENDNERRREKRRDRSRSPDDRRERKRDRYRSRSRDAEDRRERRKDGDRRDWSRSRGSDDRRKRRKDREYDDDRDDRRRRH